MSESPRPGRDAWFVTMNVWAAFAFLCLTIHEYWAMGAGILLVLLAFLNANSKDRPRV